MKKAITILLTAASMACAATSDKPLLNFVNNLDWSFFADKTEFTTQLCNCEPEDKTMSSWPAGIKVRIAEPVGVIETTNTPWRLVSLGMDFDESTDRKQGNSRGNKDGQNMRHTHFIAFAPFGVMNFIQDFLCLERISGFNFLYWSEIIPTQNSDVMAMFKETGKGPIGKAWYNLPPATAACGFFDCPAATYGKPLNSLHWCTGCAGTTGNITAYGNGKSQDPIEAHSVYAMGAIDDLHFGGLMSKTSNASFVFSPSTAVPNTMCQPAYFPMQIKTQYYLQLMYPTVWDAQTPGKFRTMWANHKNKPGSEDDVATWVWSIKDTCMGAATCKSMFSGEANN